MFASQGYAVAILSRSKDRLDGWAQVVRRGCRGLLTAQLDRVARARLQHDGELASDAPLCRAFACDMLRQDTITKAIEDILQAWPERRLGTCAYNGSIRKRGPLLEGSMKQLQDSVDASMCDTPRSRLLTLQLRLLHVRKAYNQSDGSARRGRLTHRDGRDIEHAWRGRIPDLCRRQCVGSIRAPLTVQRVACATCARYAACCAHH